MVKGNRKDRKHHLIMVGTGFSQNAKNKGMKDIKSREMNEKQNKE